MPNKVVSKYFSPGTGMDDSLSDFKEKKKYNTGPKNVKKTRNTKKPKHTRGQKDIRALIKKQENDVLAYSNDFNKICKQVGVDVDSEELQLAIALSKSHHDVKKENSSDIESNSTEQLTSQQRILKIKTTLEEYGFRVPKTKITETNRRKRYKKQYKLLLTSETERQQIISDKYSEVLARNIFESTKVFECDYSDKELFYKATNIAYEHIKNDDVYYVTDLFEKSCHKNCLLRNWSEIPGRPLSPTVEVIDINFDDIICNQHELDCILSGTIFAAQQIVTNKNQDIIHNNRTTIDKTDHLECHESKPLENEVGHIDNLNGIKLITENIALNETSCYTNLNTMSVSQIRCVSPDLFDDEVSAVMESPDNDVQLSGQTLSKGDNIHTYCMDLTECVNIDSSDLHAKTKLHTNNEISITSRKSNDLMEITECVSSTSSKQINVENIDLTQSSNESDKQNDDILSQNKNIEVMDLTQVKDYDPLPAKIIYTEKNYSLDDTIILVDDDTTVLVYDSLKMQPQKQNLTLRDLPESICTDDIDNNEANSSSEKGKDQRSGNSFKDHLYNNTYESNYGYKSTLQNIGEVSEYVNELVEHQPGELDLTQSSNSSQGEMLTNQPISNYSTYSTSLGKRDNMSIDYDEINEVIGSEYIKKSNDCRYVSCSLEKDANKDIASNPNKTSKAFECLENESNYDLHQSKHCMNTDFRCSIAMNDENSSLKEDAFNPNLDTVSNPSKSSEVFEISDKEFNYSVHQSKYENFDFRDVSVMNDFSHYKNQSIGKSCHFSTSKKRSLSESNLLKENIISPHKEQSQSQKLNFNSETSNVITIPKENNKSILNTPKNGEYIIKTNEVTPMLDYASMSTPERHKELEKYGLKPFKRKRAIQLLTYLYNQTHPVVESHDDCLSPSKRQKRDDGDKKCSSPKKTSKSELLHFINKISKATVNPIQPIPEVNIENDLYAITTEQPDIRNIECNTEDWFFQKREKAKVYSCKVPLHVAFHNYVSCRRRLREAILRYEPVNIDVIHKDLVATGYRYNPKDLLKFMDRKCITVKTADNSRNKKS
ncbi:structure-specific endonuclease subunit SLX4 [Maniola jurtina]|uniref:structure-specific endonuclease subunit SLX4 n=1 Tax=Maniola jurtina TaxID=191418 RepID=UPI001E6875C6|nr:structure-specific endonuclease subunit SLX4 [Maniola jurtina]XP_045762842.1 structure-specific endonuclease subunit SLX4 [Maniola jurtina]